MYARVGLRGMMITHAQKEGIAHQSVAKYQTKRLKSYRKMHLSQLLGKDVLLFAARGVTTAYAFVDEAFKAAESSSEETVMGRVGSSGGCTTAG